MFTKEIIYWMNLISEVFHLDYHQDKVKSLIKLLFLELTDSKFTSTFKQRNVAMVAWMNGCIRACVDFQSEWIHRWRGASMHREEITFWKQKWELEVQVWQAEGMIINGRSKNCKIHWIVKWNGVSKDWLN